MSLTILNEQLKNLILYIISIINDEGSIASIICLVKFLYLIDVEYYRYYGKTLTGLEWVYHKYGPYAFALPEVFRQLNLEAEEEEYHTSSGYSGRSFLLPAWFDSTDILSPKEQIIVDRILKWWMWEDTNVLLDYVYFETEPMRQSRRGDILDFSTISPIQPSEIVGKKEFRPDPAKVQALRERVRQDLAAVEKEYITLPPYFDDAYYKAMQIMEEEGSHCTSGYDMRFTL